MKYGVEQSDGYSSVSLGTFEGREGAGNARAVYSAAREALLDGDSVAIYSLSATGARFTLERATQARAASLSTLFH